MSPQIITKPLGTNGPLLPRLGLGCMSLSGNYGMPADDAERFDFLSEAYAMGETFWDTADEYKDSEDLLGAWFAAHPSARANIFLATKFGIRRNADVAAKGGEGMAGIFIDSSPEYCKQALQKSLSRLGLEYVDLYYVHRVDGKTPVEKTMEAMLELQREGKIRHIGLSECSADTIRRASKVGKVAAVQVEYSPFCTEIEESGRRDVLRTCRELGIAVVAYSPLGNGVLTGRLREKADFSKAGDLRGMLPWLKEEVLEHNVGVVDRIAEVAKGKGVSAAQLSLAWVLAQGQDVFAIPGTTSVARLRQNLESMQVVLTAEEVKRVKELGAEVKGGRVQDLTSFAFGDTPTLEEV